MAGIPIPTATSPKEPSASGYDGHASAGAIPNGNPNGRNANGNPNRNPNGRHPSGDPGAGPLAGAAPGEGGRAVRKNLQSFWGTPSGRLPGNP
eukprot:1030803-Prorocentrum_minimum.AAC.1